MASFDFTGEHISIVDGDNARVDLNLLEHLEKLKAAIPSLHESRSAVKVLDAQLDPITARAIQLLKELQVEYKIHPLLEDNDAFAQG